MTEEYRMLKIGEFSLLSKISIHMLRHYDEIGLLKPVYVDTLTSYRYYDEKQLSIANRIQALKGMGLGLPVIRQILTEYGDSTSLKTYLELQLVQKKEDLKVMQEQISLLENTLWELETGDDPRNMDIAIKEIPKRNVISCRGKLSRYSQEGELWQILNTETKDLHIQFASPSYDIAVMHGTDAEELLDVEVQRAVTGSYPDTPHTQCKTVPAITVATLTCEGGYYKLPSTNEALSSWISQNGYALCGPVMNIYHISPKLEPDGDKRLTEVCFPIQKI